MPQCIWLIYQYETCTPHFLALVRWISDFFYWSIIPDIHIISSLTDANEKTVVSVEPLCTLHILLFSLDFWCVQGQKLQQCCYEMLSNRGDDVFMVHGPAVNKTEGLNIGRLAVSWHRPSFLSVSVLQNFTVHRFHFHISLLHQVERVGNSWKPLRISGWQNKYSILFKGFVVLCLCVGVGHKAIRAVLG